MGLLDDAIRQHLDLKRQHGADPGEVAEKERQAFGPIKRGDLEVGVAPLDDAPPLDDADEPAESWADAPADPVSEEFAPDELEVAPAPTAAFDDVAPAVEAPAPVEAAAPVEEPFVAPLDEPFAPSAEPTAYTPVPAEPAYEPPPAPPAESFQDIGEPTQEYTVLDDVPDPQPDAVPGEHDELEETPDFLEETPEHDRLWFEQKPPRDFDF